MLKIFDNFEKKIKMGTALALIMSMPFSVAGCTYEDVPTGIVATGDTDCSTDDSLDLEINEETVVEDSITTYDFPFERTVLKEKVDNGEVDWVSVHNALKDKNSNFKFLLNSETIHDANHGYAIAVCEDSSNFGSNYYYIVDKNADYIDYKKYEGSVFYVNEDISILESKKFVGNDDESYYTLLNHNDGSIRTISASYLQVADSYIIVGKLQDETMQYTLYYSNGDYASFDVYDSIVHDSYTGNLYLNKGDATEVVDLVTGKARKLPVKVFAAINGYLTIGDSGKEGLYYLETLESELAENIPCEHDRIDFVNISESPLFAVYDYSEGVTGFEYCHLYSSEGKLLSDGYRDIGYDSFSTGLIDVTVSVDYETGKKISGLIDYNGNEILSNVDADLLHPIPLTDKVIFKENGEDGKYGIIDFEGNVLCQPTYDRIFVNLVKEGNKVSSETIDCLIVCRNESQQNTVVLNKDLEAEVSGNLGHHEAINTVLANRSTSNKVYSK